MSCANPTSAESLLGSRAAGPQPHREPEEHDHGTGEKPRPTGEKPLIYPSCRLPNASGAGGAGLGGLFALQVGPDKAVQGRVASAFEL